METTSAYKETPLDPHQRDVRLLQISHADTDGIKCDLEVHSIDDCPDYLALSYVWGPQILHSVLLNGYQQSVRQNLFDFLDMLVSKRFGTYIFNCTAVKSTDGRIVTEEGELLSRRSWFGYHYEPYRNPPLLWIDALCIDQNNLDERSHQVSLMADIFTKANGVLAWLGSSNYSTNLAYSYIRSIGSDRRLNNGRTDFGQPGDPSNLDFVALLSNEYWKRAWTVQEFLLPRNVIFCCGEQWCDWEDLAAAAVKHQMVGECAGHSFITAKVLLYPRGARNDFEISYLLPNWADQRCQDSRDKVYAFLSLAKLDRPMTPNYAKSVDLVFVDLVESVNWHIIDQWVIDVDESRENCHYRDSQSSWLDERLLITAEEFKKLCSTFLQILDLEEGNLMTQRAVEKAIEMGKQNAFEQFLRKYPSCVGMWENAEVFHAAKVFRERV